MRIPILRFAMTVICLVLCSTPYQVQALPHGFLYSGGSFTQIDPPGATATQALGINNTGQIVGFSNAGGGAHGFLYSGASFTPIDMPGALVTEAHGITDSGQIVGFSEPSTPVSVPEPTTPLLLGIALAGLAAWRLKRTA